MGSCASRWRTVHLGPKSRLIGASRSRLTGLRDLRLVRALINYIPRSVYGTDEAKFRRWWPAVHFIGKDILTHIHLLDDHALFARPRAS